MESPSWSSPERCRRRGPLLRDRIQLGALIEAERGGRLGPARLRCVVVNRAGAGAIGRAEAAGLPVTVLRHEGYARREDYDTALVEVLRAAGVELVALAGFMRLVTNYDRGAFIGHQSAHISQCF